MSYKPSYDKGDWRASCDVCGRDYKATTLRKRWDGLMVDDRCWEPRHPQDFVRGSVDTQVPQWTRPEPADTFVLDCSTRSSIAGYASAGCMIAGNTVSPGSVPATTFTP